jgi:glyoxylase-like metal-dependent hydrolase (beta-lactamase superfamily II)
MVTLHPGLAVIALRTPTLPPATHTNCYLVGGRELVVIDPASPYADEQEVLHATIEALAARGRRVREIWLTHHHVDHVSGAVALQQRTGAAICAHPTTARLHAGRVPIARFLADGERRTVAGDADSPAHTLRCVLTEGHDWGHLAFLDETTGVIMAGDMVAQIGTIIVDPDDGDMRTYLESLARLAALEPRTLLPAHGAPITAPRAKLAEYRQHRLWREARVLEALRVHAGPATPQDLVPVVYADVPVTLHPLAARSLEAHLIKLAKDGVVGVDGRSYRA